MGRLQCQDGRLLHVPNSHREIDWVQAGREGETAAGQGRGEGGRLTPVYVRPGAICKALGISTWTLRRWRETGMVRWKQFPAVRYHDGKERLGMSPMFRIELDSVLELLESGATPLHEKARARILALKKDAFVPPDELEHCRREHEDVEAHVRKAY